MEARVASGEGPNPRQSSVPGGGQQRFPPGFVAGAGAVEVAFKWPCSMKRARAYCSKEGTVEE